MRRFIVTICIMLAAPAVRAEGPTARAIDAAIGRAVDCLWASHRNDHWYENGAADAQPPGQGEEVLWALPGAPGAEFGSRTGLCAFALLSAGQDPTDARLAATLDWLARQEMNGVYARAFRACALSLVPASTAQGQALRKTLQADADWLQRAMRPDGAYDYRPSAVDDENWDNSNTQIALLGVAQAAEAGIEVPSAYFKRLEQHWLRVQAADGGWTYRDARGRTSGWMTAAALAGLFTCFDIVHRDDYLRCAAETEFQPIQRGLDWMSRNFTAAENPGMGPQYFSYYLYSVERVGRAGGLKSFGPHDWYAEGAAELLRTQRPDGGWGSAAETAFALLFLARGRQPVLVQKLLYDGHWNVRPRDLANLTRWMSRTFERPVRWQVLGESLPLEEWFDAPILYISGAHPPRFSDATLDKMRRFVHRGGLIVSEAACNSVTFTLEMRKVYQKLFPDYALARLEADHPIYTLQYRVARPSMLGVSNGVRLLAVHSPTDLSQAWQINATLLQGGLFEQAANLYVYATDFQPLPAGGIRPWPEPAGRPIEKTVRVARLTHRGNWQPEPLADARLTILMANRTSVDLRIEQLTPARLSVAEYGVALLSGVGEPALDGADKAALKAFCEGGGLLVVDAAGGDGDFDAAVQRDVLSLLGEGSPRELSTTAEVLHLPGMSIDRVSYRRASQMIYGTDRAPHLRAVLRDGQPAILYSRDDLTASLAGYSGGYFRGFTADSAFELMRNFILYGDHRHAASREKVIEVRWMPAETD